ncbi:hypothetical protein ACW95P_03195 [Candidatus Mycoplasma pogonae]
MIVGLIIFGIFVFITTILLNLDGLWNIYKKIWLTLNYYIKEKNIIDNVIQNLFELNLKDKEFISKEVSKIEKLQSYSIRKLPLKEQKILMAIYSLYNNPSDIHFNNNIKIIKNYYDDTYENDKLKFLSNKGADLYIKNIYWKMEFKF